MANKKKPVTKKVVAKKKPVTKKVVVSKKPAAKKVAVNKKHDICSREIPLLLVIAVELLVLFIGYVIIFSL